MEKTTKIEHERSFTSPYRDALLHQPVARCRCSPLGLPTSSTTKEEQRGRGFAQDNSGFLPREGSALQPCHRGDLLVCSPGVPLEAGWGSHGGDGRRGAPGAGRQLAGDLPGSRASGWNCSALNLLDINFCGFGNFCSY